MAATLQLNDVRDLAPAVARCRRLLDLDADPEAVDATLAADPALTRTVEKEPGVRVPRAVDGFEMAVRAIVGQQISVSATRTILGRIAAVNRRAGLPNSRDSRGSARRARSPCPSARRETIRGLARAVIDGTVDLDLGADREELVASLVALPGHRRLDGRLRRDARRRRSRRLPAHRPRRPPGREIARPAGRPESTRGARRNLAAVALVRPDQSLEERVNTTTMSTPTGPFTIIATDAGVVRAAGFTADVDELLALVHPSLRGQPRPRTDLGPDHRRRSSPIWTVT